jgi:hypothetical protein
MRSFLVALALVAFAAPALAECEQSLTPARRPEQQAAAIGIEEIEALDHTGTVTTLLVGDSHIYRWPKDMMPAGGFNFGVPGDRTEHVLWRIAATRQFSSVANIVLLVGTNNLRRDSPRCVVVGIRAIVGAIMERLPRTRIFVVGILPRFNLPEEAANKIPSVNHALAHGGPYRFIDPTRALQDARLFLPDGTHLAPMGYQTLVPMITRELASAPAAQ